MLCVYSICKSLQAIKADLTIVADGCFSKFRKGLVNSSVSVPSHFAGVILHQCPQYKRGFAEIVLPVGGSGPILVYQISSTCTRVLVDIQGKMPLDVKQYMKETVAPELPGMMYMEIHVYSHVGVCHSFEKFGYHVNEITVCILQSTFKAHS